ncbi:DUF3846 domain-containing protein [Victivallis vadensis]|uniref:DUF3846 domain-containing protein n=1 Tax=Victivallis vadensis TaxID=172901 RepID=UPI0023F62389|nr:DUF3846 domain-containing protein [Victivallis vadensis]
MARKIKGILIHAEKQTVEEIEFENTLENYYRLLDCNCIAAPSYDTSHDVIVDDEGLLRSDPPLFELGSQIYAGSGLLVGVNIAKGDWISHSLDLSEIRRQIRFVRFIRINGQILKLVHFPR